MCELAPEELVGEDSHGIAVGLGAPMGLHPGRADRERSELQVGREAARSGAIHAIAIAGVLGERTGDEDHLHE